MRGAVSPGGKGLCESAPVLPTSLETSEVGYAEAAAIYGWLIKWSIMLVSAKWSQKVGETKCSESSSNPE